MRKFKKCYFVISCNFIEPNNSTAFDHKMKVLNSMISVEKFSDDEDQENKYDSKTSSSNEEDNNRLSLKNIGAEYVNSK